MYFGMIIAINYPRLCSASSGGTFGETLCAVLGVDGGAKSQEIAKLR